MAKNPPNIINLLKQFLTYCIHVFKCIPKKSSILFIEIKYATEVVCRFQIESAFFIIITNVFLDR